MLRPLGQTHPMGGLSRESWDLGGCPEGRGQFRAARASVGRGWELEAGLALLSGFLAETHLSAHTERIRSPPCARPCKACVCRDG